MFEFEYPNEFEFIPEDPELEGAENIKLWSWRDDPAEQLEILHKWEEYYKKQKIIKFTNQLRKNQKEPSYEEWKSAKQKNEHPGR